MLPTLRLHAATAVLLGAALTGCTGSGDELDVDGFSSGACSELAPTLQEVDEALREVADEDLEPRKAADRFKAAQEDLKAQGASAAEPVREPLTELVTSLGFFRISVDSNNYDGTQVGAAREKLDALAAACRG